MNDESDNTIPPQDRANFLSKLFFAWVTPLFIKSFNMPLREDEIYNISLRDSSAVLTEKMQKKWKLELLKPSPSIMRVVISIFWKRYIFFGMILLAENIAALTQPIIIWRLLSAVKSIHEDMLPSFVYATLLIISVILLILFRNPYYFNVLRIGMQVKVGISGLIYCKILRLNQKALSKTGTGQIVNLLSNDVQRFELGFSHLHYIWIAPICTLAAVIMLYIFSKEGGVAAIVIFVLLIPIHIVLGRFYNYLRSKVAVITDDRIKMVSELINGMRVVKMYCWEQMFIKVIGELRSKELRYIRFHRFGLTLQLGQGVFLTKISISFMMIIVFYTNTHLNSALVFSILALFNFLKDIYTRFIPYCLMNMFELMVTFQRVRTFLLLSELSDEDYLVSGLRSNDSEEKDIKEKSTVEINFNEVCASWNKESSSKKELQNITFNLKSPQTCAVIGEVGSGKTSLLMTILGELPLFSGKIIVSGKIAYASQQPWVFSGSILENILFNSNYEDWNLHKILRATTLDEDLKLMPKGLFTTVGERGVTLSGGQKSRVSLARVAYSEADIILLDEPLAAVDTHVGKKIYSHCIEGRFKDKLVILVTNHIHLLEYVDKIVVLKDGCLLDFGTLSEIKKKGLDIDALLKDDEKDAKLTLANQLIRDSSYIKALEDNESLSNFNMSNNIRHGVSVESIPLLLPMSSRISSFYEKNGNILSIKDKNDNIEGFASGNVGFQIYWKYFTIGCPILAIIVVTLLYIFTMFLYLFCDVWLMWWTQEMDIRNSTINFYKNDHHFLVWLIVLSLSNFVFGLVSVVSLFMICIASSKVLHDKMLRCVLHSPMNFFDITPAGRILNRFSKDIGVVDDLLPVTLQDFILSTLLVTLGVGLSVFKNFWCIIIIIPIFGIFMFMRQSYLNMSRTIKRIENATRSPLFDHVSTTLHGLTTIRAFGSQLWFIESFYKKQDRHSKAFFLYISTSRWFAFRLDEACLLFITMVTYSCLGLLYYKKILSSDFGLILTYIIGFIGMAQWAVRQSTEVENQMISVERITEYSRMLPEDDVLMEFEENIPSDWPRMGKIKFENVSYFYEKGGPFILNNVNVVIKSKEKIGIVGRTGAGKSSLISVLFRLIELPNKCGRVLIDDVDISSVGLIQLRNSIAVIPQDPVMFMGSIRRNLDPFSEFEDDHLWHVLETVEMKDPISKLPDMLYSAVSEGGSNLSVGQRQLICMARALLKKTKIIVIDEATANVDPRTDSLIQKTLKTKFVDCTVLTIAHRLNTIIDSDKILVMSDGSAAEFDHPHALLTKIPRTIFGLLVQQTGPTEDARLRKEAEKNYKNRQKTFA